MTAQIALIIGGTIIVVVGAVAYLFYRVSEDLGKAIASGLNDGEPLFRDDDEWLVPGTMPRSVRVSRTLYRYTSQEILNKEPLLPRAFTDGPWKWKPEQQRYAGVVTWGAAEELGVAKVNVGHYFGLTAEAAAREIGYYVQKPSERKKYVLLSLEASIDNILDLTNIDNVYQIAKHLGNDEGGFNVLADLVALARGGNGMTTKFGYFAQRNGFNGILSFSARGPNADTEAFRNQNYWDEGLEYIDKQLAIKDLRARGEICLVVFSGSLVVRSSQRYRVEEGAWVDNSLYGRTAEELAEIMPASAEHQTGLLDALPANHWLLHFKDEPPL